MDSTQSIMPRVLRLSRYISGVFLIHYKYEEIIDLYRNRSVLYQLRIYLYHVCSYMYRIPNCQRETDSFFLSWHKWASIPYQYRLYSVSFTDGKYYIWKQRLDCSTYRLTASGDTDTAMPAVSTLTQTNKQTKCSLSEHFLILYTS